MTDQIYMTSVVIVFWPLFFIYLLFFYQWVDRRPNIFVTLVGALIWALVWPLAIGVGIYKSLSKNT